MPPAKSFQPFMSMCGSGGLSRDSKGCCELWAIIRPSIDLHPSLFRLLHEESSRLTPHPQFLCSTRLGSQLPRFESDISYILSVTLGKLFHLSASVPSAPENRDNVNTYFIGLFED